MSSLKDYLIAFLLLPLATCYGLYSKKVRPTLAERFGGGQWLGVKENDDPWIWVHGASVGEIAAVEPLLKRIKNQYPSHKILISVTSNTGVSRALNIPEVSAAVIAPFDLVVLYQRALGRLNIVQLIVLETELWPAMFRYAARNSIKTIIVNARISDETIARYLRFKWYFSKIFQTVDRVFAQSQQDASRYLQLGATTLQIVNAGSTKFDINYRSRKELRADYSESFGLEMDRPIVTVGCLRKEEEALILGALESVSSALPEVQFILVPRHPERFDAVAKELEKLGDPFYRRSAGDNLKRCSTVLVDKMGELSISYALADLAIVCGTFCDAGGHNPIEAAAVGTPSIVGDSLYNIKVPVEVLSRHGALSGVNSVVELTDKLIELLSNRRLLIDMSKAATEAVEELTGASDMVVDYLKAAR